MSVVTGDPSREPVSHLSEKARQVLCGAVEARPRGRQSTSYRLVVTVDRFRGSRNLWIRAGNNTILSEIGEAVLEDLCDAGLLQAISVTSFEVTKKGVAEGVRLLERDTVP